MLFCKHHCYKQHQAEIWSKIITILSIKGVQKKNKHSKWKTCWVEHYLLLQNPYIINERHCLLSLYRQFPIFTRKFWLTPSYDFLKLSFPTYKYRGVHTLWFHLKESAFGDIFHRIKPSLHLNYKQQTQ